MFKVKNGLIPYVFQNKFNMISHDYFTKKSMCNFKEQYHHEDHGSGINFLENNTKAFTSYSLFQITRKNRLINLENVVLFF